MFSKFHPLIPITRYWGLLSFPWFRELSWKEMPCLWSSFLPFLIWNICSLNPILSVFPHTMTCPFDYFSFGHLINYPQLEFWWLNYLNGESTFSPVMGFGALKAPIHWMNLDENTFFFMWAWPWEIVWPAFRGRLWGWVRERRWERNLIRAIFISQIKAWCI